MLVIEIRCEPDQIDEHLRAAGLMRRPFVGGAQTEASQPESPLKRIADSMKDGTAVFVSPKERETVTVIGDINPTSAIGLAGNPLADELTTLERPSDFKVPEAPPVSTRKRGEPSPGKKRRTAAEVAEDHAYLQTPEGAKAAAAEKAAISSGDVRINPEDAAQDAADEAAESAQRLAGPPTMDDLRAAVGRYTDKFGPEKTIATIRSVIGCAMLEVPVDKIADAIARVDLATSGSVVFGVVEGGKPDAPETSLFGDNKRTSEFIGSDGKRVTVIEEDFLPPPTATKADVKAALIDYAKKYDGSADLAKAPHTNTDSREIMAALFGAGNKITDTPEGYGKALAAINEAIQSNPYQRQVHA